MYIQIISSHNNGLPDLLQLPQAEGVELGAEGVLGARGLDERAALGGEGADLGQGGHGVGHHFGHDRRQVEAEAAVGGASGGGSSARKEPGVRFGVSVPDIFRHIRTALSFICVLSYLR